MLNTPLLSRCMLEDQCHETANYMGDGKGKKTFKHAKIQFRPALNKTNSLFSQNQKIVCFVSISVDFAIEAVGFVLCWSVSYFCMFLKISCSFCMKVFFTLSAAHRFCQIAFIIQK